LKTIKFKQIKIKNFLSIGKEEVILDFASGINLITGENLDKGGRNGVGKSSLIESIYWCLFGNTIRDIKKDKVLHNQSTKGCEVSLEFELIKGNERTFYKITRSLEPSKLSLEIITDLDKQDISLSTMPKTDEYIKELIGANEEVFQNSVIMTANGTIPFMAQKKIDKRKFLEGILNLGMFGDMLLKARADYNEKKKENDLVGKDFINEQRVLSILNENKEGFDESKSDRIKGILTKITSTSKDLQYLKDKNIEDVSVLKAKIKNHEAHIETLKALVEDTNTKAVDYKEKKIEIQNIITQAKKEKQKILDKGNTCPTCNREYCEDDLTHIEAEIKKLDDIIDTNTPIFDNYKQLFDISIKLGLEAKEKLESNRTEIKKSNESISEASLHEQKKNTLLEKIEDYNQNIKDIESETFKDDKKIETSEEKLKELENKIESLQKELLILENAKFVLSEEGVKTYIIKKMLSVLNSQLNFYLKTLDAPCRCEFDEMFEETIYNDKGSECSYFNFSGGERKRIDIAVLFMFQDVLRMQTGIGFNLSMYDELLDTGLDDKGIDKVLDVLKDKATKNNESIYIVSHKSSAKTNIDNIILLSKENGVTKIVT
jgi:DNA repair exonuclease SbcCD ATPase subunit